MGERLLDQTDADNFYLATENHRLLGRVQKLELALKDAIEEYEYACEYKGEHFVKKHGDRERIVELRAVLAHTLIPARSEPCLKCGLPEGEHGDFGFRDHAYRTVTSDPGREWR